MATMSGSQVSGKFRVYEVNTSNDWKWAIEVNGATLYLTKEETVDLISELVEKTGVSFFPAIIKKS